MEVLASKLPSASVVKKLVAELTRERDGALATKQNMQQFVLDYYLIQITLHTGLRISEMANLTWGDISDEYLIVRLGKGSKARSVYFGQATRQLVEEYRAWALTAGHNCSQNEQLFLGERGPMTRHGLHSHFKYWKDRMRLPKGFTFHSMRHFYATNMLEHDISLAVIKAQLGHASIATTSVYLHHTKSALDKLKKVV